MRVAGTTEADRAWASLSPEEQQALRRGEPLPSARRDGPVLEASPEADWLFEAVRAEGGPVAVERIKVGGRTGGPFRRSTSSSVSGCCAGSP
jgi:hypothetical protein